MLDRVGEEVARATSIVRYAAGCSFERHAHSLGEEYLVLDGVFSDESGHYPPGTYVRNPPGSSHAPFSRDGCRILVKLRQFSREDLSHVVLATADQHYWSEGSDTLVLHNFESEHVSMRRIGAGKNLQIGPDDGGAELFLVSGAMRFDDVCLLAESWIRLPPGDQLSLTASEDSIAYLKTGHLADLTRPG